MVEKAYLFLSFYNENSVYSARRSIYKAIKISSRLYNAELRIISIIIATKLERKFDEQIDTSDIAELDDEFFKNAELRLPTKKPITIRVDDDVLEWFKAQGQGYQTRINQLMRSYMETRQSSK